MVLRCWRRDEELLNLSRFKAVLAKRMCDTEDETRKKSRHKNQIFSEELQDIYSSISDPWLNKTSLDCKQTNATHAKSWKRFTAYIAIMLLCFQTVH